MLNHDNCKERNRIYNSQQHDASQDKNVCHNLIFFSVDTSIYHLYLKIYKLFRLLTKYIENLTQIT